MNTFSCVHDSMGIVELLFCLKLACVITYDLRELMFRYMFRFYMAVSIFSSSFFLEPNTSVNTCE